MNGQKSAANCFKAFFIILVNHNLLINFKYENIFERNLQMKVVFRIYSHFFLEKCSLLIDGR